ncbi:MAG: hypothetical protein R3B93_10750 [Bacteroidia bacterium]
MSTNYSNQSLSNLLNKQKYSLAVKFIEDKEPDPIQVLIAIKQNKKALENALFWQSAFPVKVLDLVMASDLKVEFLEKYFQKEENCNSDLNQCFISQYEKDFKKFFKLFKVHLKGTFLNNLNSILEDNVMLSLKMALWYSRMEVICKREKRLEEEYLEVNELLSTLPIDLLLFCYVIYCEIMRQHAPFIGNIAHITRRETALIRDLSEIIQNWKNGLPEPSFDYNQVDKMYSSYYPGNRLLGKVASIETYPVELQVPLTLIEAQIETQSENSITELFLAGFIEFKHQIDSEELISNDDHIRFQVNNHKIRLFEAYFYNFSHSKNLEGITEEKKYSQEEKRSILFTEILKNLLQEEQKYQLSLEAILEQWKFWGTNTEIEIIDKDPINIVDVLNLLKHFSLYKSPLGRIFNENRQVLAEKNRTPSEFAKQFGSNQHLSIYNKSELVKGIATFWQWEESYSEKILDFITTNLNIQNIKREEWLQRPFLEIGDQVFWLGRFMKDRDWSTILRSRIQKSFQIPKKFKQDLDRALEKRASEVLSKRVLEAGCSVNFKASNGESGDIDFWAFKDGVLLVGEAKSSLEKSDGYIHASYLENVRLEGKAAEQLDKTLRYLESDWEKAKEKLKISTDLPFHEIKVISLILTNYFEGDHKLYKEKYQKLSLFELHLIVNNDKKRLHLNTDGIPTYFILDNKPPEIVYHLMNENKNWDLWNGEKEFKLEMIPRCIEENLIWKEFEAFLDIQKASFRL